jgi:RNA polymerase sigma factor (sigma-70 family)
MSVDNQSNLMNDWRFGIDVLLHQIALGDQEALEVFQMRFMNRIMSCIRRYIDDPSETEFLFNDILYKIYIKSHSYKGHTDLSAWGWVSRISYRMAINYTRKDRSRKNIEIQVSDLQHESNDGSNEIMDPIDFLVPEELGIEESLVKKQDFKDFLSTLTQKEILVSVLLYKDNNSQKVAKILQISAARVSQLIQSVLSKAVIFCLWKKQDGSSKSKSKEQQLINPKQV